MGKIGLAYDSLDAIPGDISIGDLFTEQDGKFVLTGVEGMKSQADIDRLNEALRKEKNDHRTVREAFSPVKEFLGERSVDEIQTALDELETLKARVEAGQGGEIDEEKINGIAEKIAGQKYGPVQRNLEKAVKERDELAAQVNELKGTITNGTIRDQINKAAAEAKISPDVIASGDVVAIALSQFEVTEDGQVVHKENGLDPKGWITDQKEHRAFWWANSVGGGAGGAKGGGIDGKNPWSAKGWNLTAQARYINEHGDAKADVMAQAAGTSVGGPRPALKTG